MPRFAPANAAEAAEIIAWAATKGEGLEILAGGSKQGLGRPERPPHQLAMSRMRGVTDYEPSELRLTALAATPMSEIEQQLQAAGQMLAFEPCHWAAVLGGNGAPTLGGVIACNICGPRRVRAGAARDHFLGFSAINGRGEIWKAGGKVVKNVTGYDMCKLQCGAFGTLSLLTEITVKVMPKPEAACSLIFPALTDAAAIVLLAAALNSPYEVSAAAHLPAAVARRCGYANAVTVLRLEGPKPSIAFREQALLKLLPGGEKLDEQKSLALWHGIGTVRNLLPQAETCLWRICPTPSAAPAMIREISENFGSAEMFYDWGGGLVWLSLNLAEAGPAGGAAEVRAAVRRAGGHATIIAAPDRVRASASVFDLEPRPLAALTQRIKANFDPRFVLNPGRMQEGF
jgi:glycolate oxidase FAD binding subunit